MSNTFFNYCLEPLDISWLTWVLLFVIHLRESIFNKVLQVEVSNFVWCLHLCVIPCKNGGNSYFVTKVQISIVVSVLPFLITFNVNASSCASVEDMAACNIVLDEQVNNQGKDEFYEDWTLCSQGNAMQWRCMLEETCHPLAKALLASPFLHHLAPREIKRQCH